MKCMEPKCKREAEPGSNYCEEHLGKHKSGPRVLRRIRESDTKKKPNDDRI